MSIKEILQTWLKKTYIYKELSMANQKNKEVTGIKAASAAGRTLSNPKSSKTAKSAAASALTQRSGQTRSKEATGAKAAQAAGRTLSNPKSSKTAKSAAASALTQRPNKKK